MTSTTAATTATTERRSRPRHTPACNADRCSQGRHACPCPQACELPDYPALQDAPATRTAVLLFAGVALGVVACFVVILAASA